MASMEEKKQALKDLIDELNGYMNPADYTGRSADQVDIYLENYVKPVIEKNKDLLGVEAQILV